MFNQPARIGAAVALTMMCVMGTAQARLLDYRDSTGSDAVTSEPTVRRNPIGLITETGTTATTYSWPSKEGMRDVIVFQPVNIPEKSQLLIIAHARATSPVAMANLVGASRIAAESGATVIVPAATNGRWNAVLDPAAADDVAFMEDLLTRSVAMFGVDPSRRFMAGYSNGGIMASVMACLRSDLLTGIGMIASAIDSGVAAICETASSPVSVITFHGTNDYVLPYAGADQNMGAIAVYDLWRQQNGCSGPGDFVALPNKELFNPTVVDVVDATGCPEGLRVKHFRVTRGGHTWPDSDFRFTTAVYGATTKDVNATTEIQAFFNSLPSKTPALK